MSPVATTFVILALAIVAFMSNRIPLGIVAIGVSVALWLTGILDLGQALAGFGDPTVIFIATLFVVSEALDSTGVTAWAGQQLIARGGTDRGPLLIVVCLLVAVLTALISVNGAVAALIPVVVVVATRAALSPSQMLMPLAFSAHAGSMLALTGTPVNIIVSDAAADAGGAPVRLLRVRARRRPAARRRRCSSSCCSAAGCCPSARRPRCRRTSATSPTRCARSTRCPRASSSARAAA